MRTTILVGLASLVALPPVLVSQERVLPQAPALVPLPEEALPSLAWPSEAFTLRSEALGEEFRLFVARPPSFARSSRDYPVLLLFDGQYYFAEVQASVVSLVETGQIPELVLVGIESRDRRRDFTPEGLYLPDVGDRARAGSTLDFLERELLPVLARELRCGRPRVLLGHSHAALLVLHALASRPGVFSWGIDLDAPVHLEDDFLARELIETLAHDEPPALRLISIRSRFGWPEARWNELTALARPGDLLQHSTMLEESHESMVHAASYRALQQIFLDASTLGARELSALEIEERFHGLAASYGTELPPPEPLLRRVIEDLLIEGFGARAGEWLARYERAYGEPADHAALAHHVEEVSALGEPQETVASLLALPRATPEEMRAHLGTWRGEVWMGDGPRSGLSARFWTEADVVQGELTFERGPTMTLEFLRVRPDGALEFGFRNGMRPRGLLVYSETTPGGALEGGMEMRGVRFVWPEGERPPPTRFELVKQAAGE